jgi:hypothetical protein
MLAGLFPDPVFLAFVALLLLVIAVCLLAIVAEVVIAFLNWWEAR